MRKFACIVIAVTVLLPACITTGGSATAEPTVITLESKDAQLVTQDQLVYNEGANCVAWWEKTTDEIKWDLPVQSAGVYDVVASVACDPQFPGSTVGVTVNGKTLTFKVTDTGGWSSYTNVSAGKITLEPGTYPVLVKAIEVPDRFVANLRTLKFIK